ncbi:MAG: phosphogluconate dehydratase [Candidatus Tokpelaia sp. JSC188]|nr:MAG: phosphogluconate dehydratase [Candidatus Tokpelaia sp. JSC188]
MSVIQTIRQVTEKISERSKPKREEYLAYISEAGKHSRPHRLHLGCANQAHVFAACDSVDKARLKENVVANLGIITAYNDILSAHQPFEHYPTIIRNAAQEAGGVAQVAGGVPAMCDGVTQGFSGMELSLFSREVIAMSTAIGLAHNTFDAVLYLGVCDKIVPGLLMGALTFGYLPAVFVPAGPMSSGLSNKKKVKARQLYAEGKIDRKILLEVESQSYHEPGTCTFYGTANSNQMMMEIMGLHLPGASFINPNTPLRDALTREATKRALAITALGNEYTPVGSMIDERSFVNAIVALNATGGSTNHTIHLIAMAITAGICITWHDIAEISSVVPLIARLYPNGSADVNHFHAAGGMGFVIRTLMEAKLVHDDIRTVCGEGLEAYAIEPKLGGDGKVRRKRARNKSGNEKILTDTTRPFQKDGGIRILSGNLGHAIIKVSAVKAEHWSIEASAKVFDSQEELQKAFKEGRLDDQDFIAVVRYQGPKANGMPELHKLTTFLGVLQDRGQKVALVTDGRMSGASGKIPAAIHVTPEALDNTWLAKVRDGDLICLDANMGVLRLLVDEKKITTRSLEIPDLSHHSYGGGRELFRVFRQMANRADLGATIIAND